MVDGRKMMMMMEGEGDSDRRMMPRYEMDTVGTRHGHSRDTDFTYKT